MARRPGGQLTGAGPPAPVRHAERPETRGTMAPLGLYVHVPFCAAICHYCNFNRDVRDPALEGRYLRAVVREIAGVGRALRGRPADTLFFGGGTPSVLEPAAVGGIIRACRDAFDVAPDAEITLEANPESIDPRRLDGYRDAGVNRLSLGVQSFRDADLKRLGRVHDAARAVQAVAEARAAGCRNLSLDLMMWLPEQSIDEWLESVEALISAAPDHASLYMLELYPNAPLRDEMARARWSAAPDDDAAEMYERGMQRLEDADYRQYEISNVARPGFECRHNLKYWRDGEWLGFGPGAHSTLARTRWKNVSGVPEYLTRIEGGQTVTIEHRPLTPEEAWQEALITGLRLADGVDERGLAENFGLDLWARYGDHLQPYLDESLMVRESGRLRLTRRGMLLANEILEVFI